ncbi:MAG: hypothetical protein R6V73_09030 [Anaerolineales bacterium]
MFKFEGGNRTTNKRFIHTVILTLLLLVFTTTAAFAHYCTPVNKKAGAGSVGTYNVVTETFTPSRNNVKADMSNGGFITFTDGEFFSFDIFSHQLLPEGALASGPGGDDHCDGKGIDDALACLGIPH